MTDLRLDFDGEIPEEFYYRLRFLGVRMGWTYGDVRYDRTARGWHVVISVAQDVPFPVVVAAQAILGSDWQRESFNLARAMCIDVVPDFWKVRSNTLYAEHQHGPV
jgi:hypothetical protein